MTYPLGSRDSQILCAFMSRWDSRRTDWEEGQFLTLRYGNLHVDFVKGRGDRIITQCCDNGNGGGTCACR